MYEKSVSIFSTAMVVRSVPIAGYCCLSLFSFSTAIVKRSVLKDYVAPAVMTAVIRR